MNKNLKILVVGGLSAGPAAVAKARRENESAEITLFEQGENISYATCGMPYVLSGKIKTIDHLLVVQPELLSKRFNADVRLNEKVTDVDVRSKKLTTIKGTYEYDKLIWAAGARAAMPPIKGLDNAEYCSPFRSLKDLNRIRQSEKFQKAQKIAVIGAGLIGVEVVENLRKAGKEVILLEGGSQVLPQWSEMVAHVAKKEILNNGVEVETNCFAKEIAVNPNANDYAISISSNKGINEVDYVIFSAGIKANSEILSAQGIDVEPNGAIIINDRGETSVKDVYAAGDVSTIQNSQTNLRTYLPMGTHSNKMGRAAGANAVGSSMKHNGGYGTAIIKLFNIDFARTGYHPSILEKENIEYLTTTINAGSTPSYYPDPKNMTLRIYYTPGGDLLGAEAYGGNGVDKRIDVLATCILAKMNVRDLGSIDLAYAPPFSSAKDPIAVAGYVAENQLDKKVEVTSQYVGQFDSSEGDYQLLDVRSQKEVERQGMINDAINIPLDDLRERLSELDKDKKYLVYCAGGMRAYLACRILVQNEVSDCSNLEGGYTLYQKLN